MISRAAYPVSVFLACLFLAGCAWVQDTVVNNAADFPVSHVIRDVKKTSDEYQEEKHEERVEELNQEYEEFLRSQEAADVSQESTEQSVVIKRDRDQGD